MQNKFYNWYAGNHCPPKCSTGKILTCRSKIIKFLKNNKITTHKEFLNLIRYENKVCDLSIAEYKRNIYKETLYTHQHKQHFNHMTNKEKQLFEKLEELTLISMWLSRFKEKILKDEFVFKAWKGYDFKILDSLLDKKYISFSYKSK